MWNNRHKDTDNCYKLYFITKGESYIKDEKGEYKLEAGNMYLINGNKIRSYHTESFSTYWIHFTPRDIVLERALITLETVTRLTSQEIKHEIINRDIFNSLFSLSETTKRSYLFNLKLLHLIHGVIIDALNDYSWEELNDIDNYHKIYKVVKYIDEHYDTNITLDKMANISNLSPSHFHRIFTSTMKITPTNYLIKKRMIAALSFIMENNDIKEVAYKLGFCNDAYFSRLFKKYYGVTAGEFRKNNNIIC